MPELARPVANARRKLWKSRGLKSSEPAWMRQSLRAAASAVLAAATRASKDARSALLLTAPSSSACARCQASRARVLLRPGLGFLGAELVGGEQVLAGVVRQARPKH